MLNQPMTEKLLAMQMHEMAEALAVPGRRPYKS